MISRALIKSNIKYSIHNLSYENYTSWKSAEETKTKNLIYIHFDRHYGKACLFEGWPRLLVQVPVLLHRSVRMSGYLHRWRSSVCKDIPSHILGKILFHTMTYTWHILWYIMIAWMYFHPKTCNSCYKLSVVIELISNMYQG